MRIVIDMQGAQSTDSKNRGIGGYTMELVKAIVRNKGTHEVILALNGAFENTIDPIRAEFKGLLNDSSIHVWHGIGGVHYIDVVEGELAVTENSFRRKAAEIIREGFIASLQPDVFLMTSFFEGGRDDAVSSLGKAERDFIAAVVLYDLIPLIYKDVYLENENIKKWYEEKLECFCQFDLFLAISESSRQDAIHCLGFSERDVVNISTAINSDFKYNHIGSRKAAAIRKKYGLAENYVLYTGGIDYRKNVEGLIRAYANLSDQIKKRHQLVVVCSITDHDKQRLRDLARVHGLGNADLVLTGFVPKEDLIAIYSLCKLFVFPSLYEGFGLPVLEAMACGRAVVASNCSSVPEIIGREEALFDPHDDDSITHKMNEVLGSDDFRKKLEREGLEQAKKFSWDKTALKAIKAFENLFEKRSKVNALPSSNSEQGLQRRLRLAYISPLQPDRSGISDYSAELLPVLSRYYQIDVVVRNEWVADEWVNANCGVHSVAWFRDNAHQYDRVLYHFGNSVFHDYMFDLLRDVPGVVVLHDFYHSGILSYMELHQGRVGVWLKELYASHGYEAVLEHSFAEDVADIIWNYPCSSGVIQNSLGLVSHSKNSLCLAQKWYGGSTPEWSIIPHLRSSEVSFGVSDARGKVGFADSDFVVCSFGEIGIPKLSLALLKAWLASSLSASNSCYLIFVGKNHEGDYGQELEAMIRQSGCEQNIRITGWADQTLFRQYLAAADVGVQLRTLSRGETSGTILDCMNYGLATIVNANGSMAELNKDAVWMLPDDFSEDELRQALEVLFQDAETRKKLGENAREEILKKHRPEQCAKMYYHSIERFYQSSKNGLHSLMDAIAALEGAGESDLELKKIAAALAADYSPAFTKKQLLVDVSALVDQDPGTGIQRVVKNVLWAWLNHPPEGYRIEPVYAKKEESGYRYARRFTKAFLGLGAVEIGEDDLIDYRAGDVFLALDWCPPVQTAQKAFYQKLRRQGVWVVFFLYDIVCLRLPRFFPGYVDAYFKGWLEVVIQADEVVGISRAVAEDLRCWLDEKEAPGRGLTRRPEITYSHIGADILAGSAAQPCMADFAESEQQLLQRIEGGTAFLMVATIEPRKGHARVLDAFEQLWQSGSAAMLVVVGRQGWMVEELIARIESHPELGKRLWWLEGIGDEYLAALYCRCACLIAASFGEGFGLPLIEAAQHKLPVIARDIPVFREVAGEHAYYFDGDTADDLAASLVEWLALYQAGEHPKSDDMPWLTWEECAAQLMDLIIGQRHKQNAPDRGWLASRAGGRG